MADLLKVSGRLRFYGWTHPTWDLLQPDGSAVDIKPAFWEAILSMAGKRGGHDYVGHHFPSMRIYLEPRSDREILAREIDCGIIESRLDNAGWSNIAAYFEQILVALAGRLVEFKASPDEIEIIADRTEKVPHVLYFGRGNSARVPDGAERIVCRAGEADCCIFLTMGTGGFECAKFSGPMALHLLQRAGAGEMRATRLGNCAVVGREAMPDQETTNGK
ncbi:hypothetical protein [Kaistia sp. MMO-174]|uniref:hypothetical protein n=1 Tax=Kaistia sp. MMO-174 TaxID=3081256 RepID=UPI003018D3B7